MKISDLLSIILLLLIVLVLYSLFEFATIRNELRQELHCNENTCKIENRYLPFISSPLDFYIYDISFDRKNVYLKKINNRYYLKVNDFKYKLNGYIPMNHEVYIFDSGYYNKYNAERDLKKIKSDKNLIVVKHDVQSISEFLLRLFLLMYVIRIVLRKAKEEINDIVDV